MTRYVYLIGPEDWSVGRVKIGMTSYNPLARLSCLQTGSPYKLQVYAFFEGGAQLEGLLHRTFAPLRLHGEWFKMDGKLLAFMSDLFFQAYGERLTTQKELDAAINELILSEEAMLTYEQDIWEQSAETDEINQWAHDRAWLAYCASRGVAP